MDISDGDVSGSVQPAVKKGEIMHATIIEELEFGADTIDDTPEEYYGDDAAERKQDAVLLRAAAVKLRKGELLTEQEKKAVVDEIQDWEGKDWTQQPTEKKLLREAQAELGMLEEYNPTSVYMGRRPKTWNYRGKKYLVWD